jgi:hypothetical protein
VRRVFFHATVTACLAVGCASSHGTRSEGVAGGPTIGVGIGGSAAGFGAAGTGGATTIFVSPDPGVPPLDEPCTPGRYVESTGKALLVKDADVLARFPLERVLAQILKSGEDLVTTPTTFLQRLFDTENTATAGAFPDGAHCDDAMNPAFVDSHAVQCPRAESRLARSTGFFTAGDPDSFVPVALVNRFDLMPSNLSTCGEYRIVYAKQSGFTDPKNRLFLIFEAALPNAGRNLSGCRAVAELWAGLDRADPSSVPDLLDAFFFQGRAGAVSYESVVHSQHYGDANRPCSYAGACGQIRVGQGMETPWVFRQFHVRIGGSGLAQFAPVPLSAALRPSLFDPATQDPEGDGFRASFAQRQTKNLAAGLLARIRLTDTTGFEAGESALAGAAVPNFSDVLAKSGGGGLGDRIAGELAMIGQSACPPGDPLTSDSIVERATAVSCAGCHAPAVMLGESRSVGCGVVWPKSLGEAHIDEHGALSEALTDVFLPYRAGVLETYLQSCDPVAVAANLQPSPPDVRIECFVSGTPITMADGSVKPIERVRTGDLVLTFDEGAHGMASARVQRTVVRRDADHLVSIDGGLVATDNHPFRTARGWVRAGELQVGDRLLRARDVGAAGVARFEMQPSVVGELAMLPGTVDTYNLDVEGTHAYFAGGLLVHDRP